MSKKFKRRERREKYTPEKTQTQTIEMMAENKITEVMSGCVIKST